MTWGRFVRYRNKEYSKREPRKKMSHHMHGMKNPLTAPKVMPLKNAALKL